MLKEAVAHYALGGLENIMAARYHEALPEAARLAAEIERAHHQLEARR